MDVWVRGIWKVFVLFFQLFCICENLYSKIVREYRKESLSNLPQVSPLILVELGFKPSQSGYTLCPVNLYAILPLWTYMLDESVKNFLMASHYI